MARNPGGSSLRSPALQVRRGIATKLTFLLGRRRHLLIDIDVDVELDGVLASDVVETDAIAWIDLPERPPVGAPFAYGATRARGAVVDLVAHLEGPIGKDRCLHVAKPCSSGERLAYKASIPM